MAGLSPLPPLPSVVAPLPPSDLWSNASPADDAVDASAAAVVVVVVAAAAAAVVFLPDSSTV